MLPLLPTPEQFRTLRQALSEMHWNVDLRSFCAQLTLEPDVPSSLEKFEAFQTCIKAMEALASHDWDNLLSAAASQPIAPASKPMPRRSLRRPVLAKELQQATP